MVEFPGSGSLPRKGHVDNGLAFMSPPSDIIIDWHKRVDSHRHASIKRDAFRAGHCDFRLFDTSTNFPGNFGNYACSMAIATRLINLLAYCGVRTGPQPACVETLQFLCLCQLYVMNKDLGLEHRIFDTLRGDSDNLW